MLNCRDITERSSEFLDGELTWWARVQLRLHLMLCRPCREYVRQMALVVSSLRHLADDTAPPEDLVARVRAAARADRESR